MNRGKKNQPKKILLRVRIEGRKAVTKEALVCCKSKKIIKFL
jgi:hypothetical protein